MQQSQQQRRRPPSQARLQGRGRGRGRGRGGAGRGGSGANAPAVAEKVQNKDAMVSEKDKEEVQKEEEKKEGEEKEVVGKMIAPSQEDEEDDDDESEAGEGQCLICVEPVALWSLGSCNHRSACWQCGLRRRELYEAKECIICKLVNDEVIFTAHDTKRFEAYDRSVMIRDQRLKIYFETEAAKIEANRLLYEVRCPACRNEQRSSQALKKHVIQEHGQYFCDLCLELRKVFLHEQKTYPNKEALQQHVLYGDKVGEHIHAHPPCDFCRTNFYGVDQLWKHLRDKHNTCTLCEHMGVQHQYFLNMTTLRKHYKKDHYPCLEEECDGVVFNTAGELKAHDVSVHLPNRNLSKAEERKARTLDINITYSRPEAHDERAERRGGGRGKERTQHDNRAVQLVPAPAPPVAAPANSSLASPALTPMRSTSPVAPQSKEELERRNERVVEAIRLYLGDEQRFAQFRRMSADFRKGTMSPQAYYEAFLNTFGPLRTDEFLPELTALLPDAERRGALERIHLADRQRRANPADFPSLPTGATAPASTPVLSVASAAAYNKNRRANNAPFSHVAEQDFPALAGSADSTPDEPPPPRAPASAVGAWAPPPAQAKGGKKKNNKGTVLMKWG